ncbi:pentatricopeptide repeat-containing protein At1g63080, mitochondrial-like [Mangifera indica]|uniref:pentatricopeptide repeat-containing protein At1g63080, mitochondrial-like n=1 Tax=Mangifera indica TaxID=29780 RepID=UPI001CFC4129|nr:pentatricopeptide repeat-containing protein At1g63080, mitochondrial-like [Mangifera indica]
MASVGCKPNVFSYNILMEGLCLTNKIDDAKELLASMLSMGCTLDVVSYNTLINGYCKNRKIDEALNLYEEMTSEGVRPDVVTYSTLLSGFFMNGNIRHAKKLFGRLNIAWEMFNGFCKEGKLEMNNETLKVVELLHKMKERNVKPDASIGSIILDLLGKHEDYREVLNLLPSFSTQEPTGC